MKIKSLKKYEIIFITNASGGIATFQSNLVNFFSKNKIYTTLIDKSLDTIKELKSNKYNKFYRCNVLKDYKKIVNIFLSMRKNNLKKKIFIISNPTIFSIYFLIIKLLFNNSKIIVFYHSHIYKINLHQITVSFISSIFSKTNIYVSKFTKKWWNTFFPFSKLNNQKVIYNYISLPKKIPRKDYSRLNIGFVGRFEKEKGIEKFLEIASSIRNKKFCFHIFGSGSIKVNKTKYKNIKLHKWSKKELIYKKINTLFVTSKIENCPFTVLEAKSYGIPTITISEGGIKEIIKNNHDGIVLDKNTDKRHIEVKLNYLLENFKKFERKCIKNSKKFDLSNYNYKIFDII